jgi:hypothetical protein
MVALFSHSLPHFVDCGLLTQILKEAFDACHNELVDLRVALRAIGFGLRQIGFEFANRLAGASILALSSDQSDCAFLVATLEADAEAKCEQAACVCTEHGGIIDQNVIVRRLPGHVIPRNAPLNDSRPHPDAGTRALVRAIAVPPGLIGRTPRAYGGA